MNLDTLQVQAKEIGQGLENFPEPSIPLDGDSYEFPNNADNLSDEQLDSWLMFFGAWRGYVINQIAQRDGEVSLLGEGFDLMMSSKSADFEAVATKRLLKEALRGTILNENSDLFNLSKKIHSQLIEPKNDVVDEFDCNLLSPQNFHKIVILS